MRVRVCERGGGVDMVIPTSVLDSKSRKVLVTCDVSRSFDGLKLWDCEGYLWGKLLNMLYGICHYWIKKDLSEKKAGAFFVNWAHVDRVPNFADASVLL